MLSTQFVSANFSDGTFTDNNSLARAMLNKPEIADTVIYALGYGAASGGKGDKYNLFQYLTSGSGRVGVPGKTYKPIGAEEHQWALFGATMEAQIISGTVTPTSQPGVGFTEFTVPFAKRYFHVGDVCRFEDDTLARVCHEPTKVGSNWCYKFVIVGSNTAAFVSTTAVEPMRYVTYDHNAFEEGSDGGGTFEATPMWFKNQMTISRKAKGYTGSSLHNVTVLKFGSGKKDYLWMPEAQFQFMKDQMRSHENQLFSGRYNRLADGSTPIYGTNGRVVSTGSGIDEQLSGANSYSVPSLTTDLFWQVATDASDASKGGENRHTFLVTGNGGMFEFQKMGDKFLNTVNAVDASFFMMKAGAGNQLKFGKEWKTYMGPDGSTFTVVNHPMFNDKTVFAGTTGPKGWTKQSYNMYFLDVSDYDLGNGETVSNMTMITKGAGGKNRQLRMWYTAGAETPGGDLDGSTKETTSFGRLASHGGDYYMSYILQQTGVAIYNPTACGKIKITPVGN